MKYAVKYAHTPGDLNGHKAGFGYAYLYYPPKPAVNFNDLSYISKRFVSLKQARALIEISRSFIKTGKVAYQKNICFKIVNKQR